MDYEVFLLSAASARSACAPATATAGGRRPGATARVITSAALIMISVFLAFVVGRRRDHQDVRHRPGHAVLIDATVVRMVLVPATMALMGNANWWLPRWLDRLLPRSTSRAGRARSRPTRSRPSPRATTTDRERARAGRGRCPMSAVDVSDRFAAHVGVQGHPLRRRGTRRLRRHRHARSRPRPGTTRPGRRRQAPRCSPWSTPRPARRRGGRWPSRARATLLPTATTAVPGLDPVPGHGQRHVPCEGVIVDRADENGDSCCCSVAVDGSGSAGTRVATGTVQWLAHVEAEAAPPAPPPLRGCLTGSDPAEKGALGPRWAGRSGGRRCHCRRLARPSRAYWSAGASTSSRAGAAGRPSRPPGPRPRGPRPRRGRRSRRRGGRPAGSWPRRAAGRPARTAGGSPAPSKPGMNVQLGPLVGRGQRPKPVTAAASSTSGSTTSTAGGCPRPAPGRTCADAVGDLHPAPPHAATSAHSRTGGAALEQRHQRPAVGAVLGRHAEHVAEGGVQVDGGGERAAGRRRRTRASAPAAGCGPAARRPARRACPRCRRSPR